jgi:hypothetical protein
MSQVQRTDVSEFLGDLHAGTFERMFSAALSDVASAVVDNNKQGEVTLKFTIKKLGEGSQVVVAHQLKFAKPTSAGKATEEAKRETPMHVGKYGRLSLVPDTQGALDFTMPKKTDAKA